MTAGNDSPISQITIPGYGTLQGHLDQARQIVIFRNVPYATVRERWRAAVKPEPWTGIRDATKQGPICPQMPSGYPLHLLEPANAKLVGTNAKYEHGLEHDEKHCLNLNIYVPVETLRKKDEDGVKPIPVMVWIHGGAFRDGSNGLPMYDASNFVARSARLGQPTIVVAVNYRLNLFGFIASKELEQEMKEDVDAATAVNQPFPAYNQSIGNWGLMDQKLALEWVRENIAVFGGNDRDVTAWGESAGSISIHYHMLCPAHHGLFDHAILQSGSVLAQPPWHVAKDGQPIFDGLLQKLNISLDLEGSEKMKRLRAVPMEELERVGGQVPLGSYRPYYDGGKVIPSSVPIQTITQDPYAYDPSLKSVMIGSNRDEGTVFAAGIHGERNLTTWPNLLKRFAPVPELMSLFEIVYGAMPETDEDVVRITAQYTGDLMFLYPVQVATNALLDLAHERISVGQQQPLKVVRYHFDTAMVRMNEIVPGVGAMHALEIPFVFKPSTVEAVLTTQEIALSERMQSLWIQFANHQKLEVHAEANNDEAIIFTKDNGVELGKGSRFSKEAMIFWGKITQTMVQAAQAELVI